MARRYTNHNWSECTPPCGWSPYQHPDLQAEAETLYSYVVDGGQPYTVCGICLDLDVTPWGAEMEATGRLQWVSTAKSHCDLCGAEGVPHEAQAEEKRRLT